MKLTDLPTNDQALLTELSTKLDQEGVILRPEELAMMPFYHLLRWLRNAHLLLEVTDGSSR